MIEEILPSTKTRVRILKIIYENPEINLTQLIKKAKTSPNIVLKYVNTLTNSNILKEKRLGGKKKTHIRTLKANLTSNSSILIFSFIEIEKRSNLLKKYKELRPFIIQLTDLLNNSINFSLIYGSFARFSIDKESDIDILIVGNINQETRNRISEIFSTLKREFAIKIETLNQFKKRINEPLHQNILREHIIINNEINFIKTLSNFY
tara:strand:- start:382 stop:1002 length:621 start_codon:yes stop_codon:yes gene_type:complete